jgi:hypothetical protein
MLTLSSLAELLGSRARPELSWVSKVTDRSLDEVDRAVEGVTKHARTVIELSENITRTGRAYYAQFPAPIDLYTLVVLIRPKSIIESGVASGVSSTFILLGIHTNSSGTLHSIDLPVQRRADRGNQSWAIPSGMSSGWGVPPELRSGWDLRLGRSEELLKPLLDEVGELDFYCHDSPAGIKHFEFEMRSIRRHLTPGSLVVADNTDRTIFDKTARSLGAKAFYRRQSSLGAFLMPP